MNITVIGTGFVGVVSAAVYSSLGHTVFGLDIDEKKIEGLSRSKVPFFEPDLEELLKKQQKGGNLSFTTAYEKAISQSELMVIAVGTPSKADGEVNLDFVYAVIDSLVPYLQENSIIAVKSTVPPGTFKSLHARISAKTKVNFHLASLPEFLKEGTAVSDALNPDRVVIGAEDLAVADRLSELHSPLGAPIITVSPESAQMGKYAANAYLATRITFINEIANLCQQNGADIEEVIKVFGHDQRIGMHYWYPGFGYGGSCFPKDVKELSHISQESGDSDSLFTFLSERNKKRIPNLLTYFEKKIGGFDGRKVAVLGLSFKPHTDDIREAPSLAIIPNLVKRGAVVVGYDPKAQLSQYGVKFDNFTQQDTIDAACKDADIILALIEWPEITEFSFKKVRKQGGKQYFIDARNQFSPSQIQSAGFSYLGIGR